MIDFKLADAHRLIRGMRPPRVAAVLRACVENLACAHPALILQQMEGITLENPTIKAPCTSPDKAPYPQLWAGPDAKTPEDLRALADKIEAQDADRAASAARFAQIEQQKRLAQATYTLLNKIQAEVCDANPVFAEFRPELQPLANSYGYKIVLVGDKTAAALVQI